MSMKLRAKLAEGRFFVVPGVQDMIAAVLCKKLGFEIVYGSGYWLTASAYGLPDAGIATYTQMVDRMATLVRTAGGADVIADADTGYGGLLNVHHTVCGYAEAGIAAIQLEDQDFPKKCGHTRGKRLVSAEEMADKVAVAREAAGDMLIIARTDANQSEGLSGVMRRLEAYAEAGADILFPEALSSKEDMRTVARTFDLPVLANLSNGGLTPIMDAYELEDLGFSLGIYPALTSLVAARAMERALIRLRDTGVGAAPAEDLFDFGEFCSLIGFEEVWAFEDKWKRPL